MKIKNKKNKKTAVRGWPERERGGGDGASGDP